MAARDSASDDDDAERLRLFRASRAAFQESIADKTPEYFVEAYNALALPKPAPLLTVTKELAALNRYDDVIPVAKTVVRLTPWAAPPRPSLAQQAYVNANHMDFGREDRYILTQGPLAHTTVHFWQMVWEQNIHLIVMLGECAENGVEKVFQYWPSLDEQLACDQGSALVVTLTEERLHRSGLWSSRTMQLADRRSDAPPRTVVQMQMHAWIDHGTPREADLAIFLTLVDVQKRALERATRTAQQPDTERPPTLVHCSAGVGRSGVFVGLRALSRRLEAYLSGAVRVDPARLFDVAAVVRRMRSFRARCVQTAAQFEFMHRFLLYMSEKYAGFDFSTF